MIQIAGLKQEIGIIIAAGIFGLIGAVSAEEITLIHFKNPSGQGLLGDALFPKNSNNSLSFGISIDERQPSSLGTRYSKSALEDYDFRFRGMNTTEKANTLDTLKAAMDEFEILHGMKETLEDTEKKFESYFKKMMLKGEFNFDNEDKTARVKESDSTPKLRGKTASFFRKVFLPDRIGWNFDADINDLSLGAELYLGDYITIRGGVGDDTKALMMFKFDF